MISIQPQLFADTGTIEERFAKWIRRHPEAYEHFVLFAIQAAKQGRQRFGSKAIVERMRWFVAMEWQGQSYKINNDFTALLSRKFIRDYPEYTYLFETRQRKTL